MSEEPAIYWGGGLKIGSYLDGAREYMKSDPRIVGSWTKADVAVSWIGRIVRLKRSYWKPGVTAPYGIVVEVGRRVWLGVIWADGADSKPRYIGGEVDSWRYANFDDVQRHIFQRTATDAQLQQLVQGLSESALTPTKYG